MRMNELLPTAIDRQRSREHPDGPDVVTDANALCDLVMEAAPGDAITYHVGFLARDRYRVISKLPEQRRLELDARADCAALLMEAGWVHLPQRRIGLESFAYLVIVRPRPRQLRRDGVVERKTREIRSAANAVRVVLVPEAA